ncbi:MAG: adenylate cyclase [Anaerolineaceae bacterium]|jgi:hypothetical protein
MLRANKISSKVMVVAAVVMVLTLVFAFAPTVVLANNPTGMGQPSQSCQVTTVTPGNAASAPGSAFNPGGVAGGVYAGTQPQNSNNTHSVSQYDVACYQNTIH